MNPRTALSIYLCVTCPLILRIKLNGTLQKKENTCNQKVKYQLKQNN